MMVFRDMAMISMATLLLSGGAGAMGLLGGSRPTDLSFNDAAHLSTPIMVDALRINETKMGTFPTLASSRWMNPRGGSATLTTLPWIGEEDQIIEVYTEWTEIISGRAYKAELSIMWDALYVEDIINATAYMTFVYGRDGEFLLFTNADRDPKTGQHNGREVARICGQRAPNRDQNYGLRVNEIPGLGRLIERREQWMAVPKVETSCSGAGA